MDINEIAQQYVSQHAETISLALNELSIIIQLLERKPQGNEHKNSLNSWTKPEENNLYISSESQANEKNLHKEFTPSNLATHFSERVVASSDPYKDAVLENGVFIKRVDNPLLNNNLFVIPDSILSFFKAENLSKGEKKEITLTYHSQYFKATVYKKETVRGLHNKATILNWDESFKAKIKENIVDCNNMPLLMITQSFVDDNEYDVEVKTVE